MNRISLQSFSTSVAAALLLATAGCAGDRYNRSTGQYIDDHSLQLRVAHALNDNPDYKFHDVTTEIFRGEVELNGFVDTSTQKNQAGAVVQQVTGVRHVDNNILVEENNPRSPGEVTDDKALASRIRNTLNGNPEYKFEGVTVAAYKGAVQISGFVDTSDQKGKAEDLVRQVSGVKSVQNNVTAKDKMAM